MDQTYLLICIVQSFVISFLYHQSMIGHCLRHRVKISQNNKKNNLKLVLLYLELIVGVLLSSSTGMMLDVTCASWEFLKDPLSSSHIQKPFNTTVSRTITSMSTIKPKTLLCLVSSHVFAKLTIDEIVSVNNWLKIRKATHGLKLSLHIISRYMSKIQLPDFL